MPRLSSDTLPARSMILLTRVFIDLDSDGDWFAYESGSWTTGPIAILSNCTNGTQLYPRTNGYTVRALCGLDPFSVK